ncbi:hypothetical protein U1Q18_021658 [Sarracenia purpurea var. burkii]
MQRRRIFRNEQQCWVFPPIGARSEVAEALVGEIREEAAAKKLLAPPAVRTSQNRKVKSGEVAGATQESGDFFLVSFHQRLRRRTAATVREESGERETIFRRFTAFVVPTSERIPALCSGARISERVLGFSKEEGEPEAHGLFWHQIKLGSYPVFRACVQAAN